MSEFILPENITCGYFDCSEFGELKISKERISKCYEIEYFLESGKFSYLNGEEIAVKSDRVIVAKPGDKRHSLLPFKTAFLKFEAKGKLSETLDSLPSFFDAVHKSGIKELMHEIIVINEKENKDILLLHSKILSLISLLIKDSKQSKIGVNFNYGLMHSAKKYIEKNYIYHISTEDIAKSVNLSESRFRYLFTAAYGLSPHAYLTEVRITNAKEMLFDNDIPITEIAERCGFNCQQYLNDTFKKATGISPGKYREQFARKYLEG